MDPAKARPGFALSVVRWAARVLGIPPTAMVVVFLIAHAVAEEETQLASVADFAAVGSIALMAIAFVAAWFWEAAGGAALLAGYVILAVAQGRLVPAPFYLFFPALGLVFVWCHSQSGKSRPPGEAGSSSS